MKEFLHKILKVSISGCMIFGLITVLIIATTKIQNVDKCQVLLINLFTFSGCLFLGTLIGLFFEFIYENSKKNEIAAYISEVFHSFFCVVYIIFFFAVLAGVSYQAVHVLLL